MQNDPELRHLLRDWRVTPSAKADFNTAVWRRIAAAEDHGLAGLWTRASDWLLVQLPKPAYASALLLATAVLGSVAAGFHASHMRESYREKYARQYLSSIDPLAMAENTPRSLR